MSKAVDEKIVSMRFDNKNFESNVQTSLNTLDKLKSKLKLSDAAKGLENIDSAAKNMNMSGISNAVDSVKLKFSAFQVSAVTALSNIVNSAVNAGKRIVSALTIDPVKMGFSEYETQINAVQTILANTESKGTTLNDVNGALDELNKYADMTIYNFTEMTRNIGTFTAAGVDLDTSVSAIKGIANLAAVSGSNSQQASTAMYQLSQALASGTVKLMDWNSVVNAGMGGQVFQDALKETARVHGISIDDMIKKEGSFRETLSSGWLSSEILTETLSKFTGDLTEEQLKSMGYTDEQIKGILKLGQTANDAATKVKTFTQLIDTLKEAAQSGWTQTWEILIGDFEEAKELWSSVSDVFSEIINSSAEARNKLLQEWSDLGGRTALLDSFKNIFKAIVNIVKPIKEAFREIFPAPTAKQLLKITEAIRDFTSKLILSEKAQAKLKSTFKGLFSIIDIGVTFIKELASGIVKLFKKFTGLGKGILGVTGSFGDWVSKIRDSIKESGIFATVIGKIVDVLQKVIDKVKMVFSCLGEKIVAPGFEGFLKLMKGLWEIIKVIGEKVWGVISGIAKGFGEALTGGGIESIIKTLNAGIVTGILLSLKKFIGGFTSSLEGITGIADKVTGILDSVKGCFESYQKDLQAKTLLKIAAAIAILAASILVLASIEPSRLESSLGGITMLFVDLIGSMALFNKIGTFQKGIVKASVAMVAISVAILILASALKVLSGVDTDGMITGILGIVALSMIIVGIAKVLSTNTKTVMKGATSLIIFALAIKILASACKDLSSLSWEELTKGLIGVGGLMLTVTAFLNNAKFSKNLISTAIGMVILAASIKILASACSDFSTMSWEGITKGLIGIAGALLAVMVAVKLMPKNMISIGLGLLAVSGALLIMAKSIASLGGMTWEEVARGLVALAGSLLILAGGLFLMQKTIAGSAALVIAAIALRILAPALVLLGSMSWESVGKGLVLLAGALLILAVGLTAMIAALPGAAALVVAAIAIGILAPALLLLGAMSWESIAKGLVTLAGAFLILGIAGLTLGPLTPIILALSAAIILAGIGMLAFGVGVVALAAGITALAAAFAASGPIIINGITALLTAIIGMIPSLIAAIGQGIITICNIIANSASAICGAVTAIILGVMQALDACIPKIVGVVFRLLDAILLKLVEYTPKIVKAVFDILIACLEGIAKGLPRVVESAVNIIVNFINGLSQQLPRIIEAGANLVVSLLQGIANSMSKVINAGANLVISLMQGIANSMSKVVEAGVNIVIKFLNGISKNLSKLVQAGWDLIINFIDGITASINENTPRLIASIKALFKAVINAAVQVLTGGVVDLEGCGGNLIDGLKKGMASKLSSLWDNVKSGFQTVKDKVKSFFGINSPSKVFAEYGEYLDEGLIVGLNHYSGKVADSAEGVGKSAVNSLSNSISGIAEMVNSDIDSQPTIRPVLDLSNVESGVGRLNGLFGMQPSVGVLSNVSSISSMMNKRQNGDGSDIVSAIKDLTKKIDNNPSNVYNINGITYDDGSNITSAIETIIRAARIEGRS